LLNRVPALIGWGKGGNVISARWQVTLCDPLWQVSFHSGETNCWKLQYFVSPYPINSPLSETTQVAVVYGKTLGCGVLGPRIKAPQWPCVYHSNHRDISLGHGLCTLTAVPRLTQPFTFCGTVKWVLVNVRVKSGESPLPGGR